MRAIFSLFLFFSVANLQAISYEPGEAFALYADAQDPLKNLRDEFYIPTDQSGNPLIYFCGHSLGLQPKKARTLLNAELDAWSTLGVEGHFKGDTPWYSYHTLVQSSLAKIVGAKSDEVVAMNSLTVNIHLMMVSFYRPTENRYKIVMEAPVFSSDTYAIKSQIQFHGYDPESALIIVTPREGENYLRMEDVYDVLDKEGDEVALVFFSGVNYLSGQYVDIEALTAKAHDCGALIGFDLAHTIGNIPLHLHDWNVDFAAWCSYKYLNAGPGAIGGAFVHSDHCQDETIHRFSGWWGNNPDTRFALHLQPNFIPVQSADSWQISNPSIFALAPLRASLELYEKAGVEALREKSKALTGYLEYLLGQINSKRIAIITPSDPEQRGCQLAIQVDDRPELLMQELHKAGIVCDFRRPNILRVAPIPFYNTFHEVWQFAKLLEEHLASS